MVLVRQETALTFRSGGGGVFYTFEVAQDTLSNVTVRNIVTPTGRVTDSVTGLPEEVINDIQTAIGQVEDLVAQTSAVGGQLTFTNAVTASFVFGIAFSNTNYRVHPELPEFVDWRVTNKATTGFTIELSAPITGTVGFDVFV